ncbi:glycosyltransferase [Roseomonas sp. CCTCC AB2023176]|uniref:glycosyltransferase n=1 Tax=Roseomonas sp. CCTCC AB2023176 TaxID=3342640 RepID=UPI0035DC52D7
MSEAIAPYIAAGARYAGAVDSVDPECGLRGWVLDLDSPGATIVLEVYWRTRRLAEAYCMLDRPDLAATAGRLPQCGFLIGWSRFDALALAEAARLDPSSEIEVVVSGTDARVPVVCGAIQVGRLHRLVVASPAGDLQGQFRDVNDFREIANSGLFDEADYVARHAHRFDPAMPPLLDYIRRGERSGARPNLLFDPVTYAGEAQLGGPSGALLHYIRARGLAGIRPSFHFDDRWYARRHGTEPGAMALAHYLAHRDEAAPNPWFDRAYYASVSGQDPHSDLYAHFVEVGLPAGLMPSAGFADAHAGGGGATLPAAARHYFEVLVAEAGPPPARPDPAARAPATTVKVEAVAARPLTAPPLPAPPLPTAPLPAPAFPPAAAAAMPPARPAGGTIPMVPRPAPRPDLPDVAALGYAGTEAALRALAPEAQSELAALAERILRDDSVRDDPVRDDAGGGDARAQAGLTLAILRGMNGDRVGAARAAETFLGATFEASEAIRQEVLSRLAVANHALFEAGQRDDAGTIYRLLRDRGARDYLTTLRLVERAVDRREIAAAADWVVDLEADHAEQMSVRGWLAVSRYYQLAGSPARAAAVLRRIPTRPETDLAVEGVIINRLVENDDAPEAARRLLMASEADRAELVAPRFRLAIRTGDENAAIALLDGPEEERLPNWLLVEAMFHLTAPGRLPLPVAGRLQSGVYRVLCMRGLTEHGVVQARIHFLLHGKRWAELGELFAALEGSEVGGSRETLMRRLEYYCYADNPEGAERLYREHFAGTALDRWESVTVLRLLGETGRWEEAGRVLLAHVGRGHGFGSAGHLAMRVVRRAGLHGEVLEAAGEGREAELEAFLRLVEEDLAVVRSARALTDARSGRGGPGRGELGSGELGSGELGRGELGRGGLGRGEPGRGWRSGFVLGSAGAGEEGDLCTYVCTNRRYFLSMLTFLCSFLGQSPQVGGRVFAFLDRDVPRHWWGAVAMVAARFGRAVEVVGEAEFVPQEVEHREAYGFFAGGGALSRAAYFRLYAARWLRERGAFRRVAYIDTDTICRGDLSGMFELEMGRGLIAAALEDHSPDVVAAAARNGLDAGSYFNSGVLLLRFDHPGLAEGVEEAIRVSEREPERLVFHDQCALNIAFGGRAAALPGRYNFFLRPGRERNGHLEDGLLLHFLDRPKPWDIVFDRPWREEWRVWALVLGSILPQTLYIDIFASANRD